MLVVGVLGLERLHLGFLLVHYLGIQYLVVLVQAASDVRLALDALFLNEDFLIVFIEIQLPGYDGSLRPDLFLLCNMNINKELVIY